MADTAERRLARLAAEADGCVKCPLHAGRTRAVPGEGSPRARVMLIGEGPGAEEDESGRPFVGASGRFLTAVLEEHGLDRRNLFITSMVKCRPPENRKPRKAELDTCTAHYLFDQIELVDPDVVVLLGGTAANYVLGGVGRLSEARERLHERDGRRYLVTYHPAAHFYRRSLAEQFREDIGRLKDLL